MNTSLWAVRVLTSDKDQGNGITELSWIKHSLVSLNSKAECKCRSSMTRMA